MAHNRESFPGLEDIDASNVGKALSSAAPGLTPTARVGAMMLAFRDSAGNLVLPQLDSEGRLPVTNDASGIPLKGQGELAAGSATLVAVTGAEITLVATKNNGKIAAMVACTVESLFQIIASDAGVETILAQLIVGPGQYTAQWNPDGLEVLAGPTGVQKLLIKGQNLVAGKVSALTANISAIQFA